MHELFLVDDYDYIHVYPSHLLALLPRLLLDRLRSLQPFRLWLGRRIRPKQSPLGARLLGCATPPGVRVPLSACSRTWLLLSACCCPLVCGAFLPAMVSPSPTPLGCDLRPRPTTWRQTRSRRHGALTRWRSHSLARGWLVVRRWLDVGWGLKSFVSRPLSAVLFTS